MSVKRPDRFLRRQSWSRVSQERGKGRFHLGAVSCGCFSSRGQNQSVPGGDALEDFGEKFGSTVGVNNTPGDVAPSLKRLHREYCGL